MVNKINAEINKVYFINKYTLIHILEGTGNIQVDFKNYYDWQDKAIYLEKGQYIKFMSDDFVVRFIDFPDEILFKSKDVRILFKHLISLGYINFNECEDCKTFLNNTVFNDKLTNLIDVSTEQWYWQNPFQANKEEYQVIFDVKDFIDSEFTNQINSKSLVDHLVNTQYNVQHLVKNKIGISISKLINNKRLTESQKDIAFTDKSIQEIAYEQGYKDPAYFNRDFKNRIGQTPKQFRDSFDYKNRDTFSQDLVELIQLFHKEEHALGFYANEMNLSVKALSKKVKQKMNVSLGQLIRLQIILSAKTMLEKDESVKNIAHTLGFEEANHFTSFFTNYVGTPPSSYKKEKYNL
ncbi:AraC family transcriptional regulator [Aquimarina sp. AD10]|uniref:AraC family transcriptional regulator n=1 Tax=Aquimarina aggregata TaxID=1642818 RepID=A0A162CUG6_9FLAO|nr:MULTISPECIES: AraC family transcriptional regulator [Aquimarina]AXT59661.1 AraC family transcriptional regulator [Aquimarina sp. AD10]KZS42354.1 AraC family transcriptional regulator [Aquimarina aggregata]RKM97537.1 AraC family transcriptional regulator [Aquimarina sp. AD10]